MVRTHQIRAKLFSPLMRILAVCGIRPDHITLLSLLTGLAFCPLVFYSPSWALFMLAMHVFLDGFDGPLVRHLGVDSPKCLFTNSMADQTVITATTLALMYSGMTDLNPGVLYLFTYTVVMLFTMDRNVLKDSYSWLFRPHF